MDFGKKARKVIPAVISMGIVALPCMAMAQDAYPSQQITIVVPFAPGGGAESVGRALAAGLSDALDVTVILDYRPGAGTLIGTEYVRNSSPDGYTLLVHSNSYVTNAVLSEDSPYDPVTAVAPVSLVALTPYVLVTGTDSGLTSVTDIVSRVQEAPNSVSYASSGYLSGADLLGQMLGSVVGEDMLHIPYGGAGPAQVSVLAGETDLYFSSLTAVRGNLDAGTLIPLAVTSAERNPALPDVPTLEEEGVDIQYGVWWGLSAPADTPSEIIDILNETVIEILATDQVSELLIAGGNEIVGTSPEDFQQWLIEDVDFWSNFEVAGPE